MLTQVSRVLQAKTDDVTIRHVDSIADVPPASAEPDCIVVPDCPAVDGIEAVRRVSDRARSAAVVVISVDASNEFAPAAKRAGADDVICLPPNEEGDEPVSDLVVERLLHAADAIEPFAEEEVLLDDLLDNIPHRVFVKNELGRFAAVSDAKAQHYDLSREELLGLTDLELAPEIGVGLREEEEAIMESGEPIVNKIEEYTDDDGRRRWVRTTKAPRRDEAGEAVGIVGSARDVTEQRRHEEMLNTLHTDSRELVAAESREEILDVATDIPDDIPDMPAVVVAMENGNGLGVEAASSEDRSYERCLPILEASYETDDPIALLDDGTHRRSDTVTDLDSAGCVAFPLGEHGALGVLGNAGVLDDSAVELAEVFAANVRTALDSAVRKERLASQNERLEEFAGIVSHDLRNPLSVAQGYLDLLDADPELVGEIDAALDRISRMSEDLLTLARDGELVGEIWRIPLDEAAVDAWELVETTDARLVFDDDPGSIEADRDRLVELFENLFSNAAQHATNGTDPVRIIVGGLDDGFFVADDGSGVPDDEKALVFERGYTTSEDGTGFGLRIVEVLANAHGWEVELVDSEAGGARIEIRGV